MESAVPNGRFLGGPVGVSVGRRGLAPVVPGAFGVPGVPGVPDVPDVLDVPGCGSCVPVVPDVPGCGSCVPEDSVGDVFVGKRGGFVGLKG